MDKIAKNLQRFRIAVSEHDKNNPDHSPAYGISISYFDLDRLGFDDGERLWSGVNIYGDSKTSGHLRILCDGSHNESPVEQVEETLPLSVVAA